MDYKYIFDKDKCLWKDVCSKYGTRDCNGCCIRYMKMHYLTNNSLLSEKQLHTAKLVPEEIDVSSFMNLLKIKEDIVNFVKQGKNLMIYSDTNGNGKTTWSVKIMLKYFSQIWSSDSFNVRGLFINVASLCNALKDNITQRVDYLQHIKDNVFKADIVIWDDIGLKSLTPMEHDYLYSFIDARINDSKTNIFTANLTGDELKKAIGDRLYSRIMGCDEIVTFKGSDKRGEKK